MARHGGGNGSPFDAPARSARRRGSNAKTAIRATLAVMIPALILLFFAVQILSQGRAGEADGSADGGPVTSHEQLTVPDQPGGGVPVDQVDIRVKEGRTNGQRDLAGEFVEAAYASPEPDKDEYQANLEDYVQTESYSESGGGSVTERIAGQGENAPEAGKAAALVEYEITSGPPVGSPVRASEIRGFVRGGSLQQETLSESSLARLVYAVGEQSDGAGGISGDASYYSQDLLLTEASGNGRGWTVIAASDPERVEDPDAGAPKPGAPKVGEPNGGGHDH